MAVVSSSTKYPGMTALLRMMLNRMHPDIEVVLMQDIQTEANRLLIRRKKASSFSALKAQNKQPPIEFRLTVFNSILDMQEFTHLPIGLHLPDWGHSVFYIHANNTWWNQQLEHIHEDRVPSEYRAMKLIL